MRKTIFALCALFVTVSLLAVSVYRSRLVNAQGPPENRPGLQSNGTFVGPDGKSYSSLQAFVDSGARCATKENTLGGGEGRISLRSNPTILALAPGSVTIQVYVHVIQQNGTAGVSGTGYVPTSWINAQLAVLNNAYSGQTGGANTPFRFQLAASGIDYTVNSSWYSAGPGTTAETQMKNALRKGTADDLNLYTNSGAGLLGWALIARGLYVRKRRESERLREQLLAEEHRAVLAHRGERPVELHLRALRGEGRSCREHGKAPREGQQQEWARAHGPGLGRLGRAKLSVATPACHPQRGVSCDGRRALPAGSSTRAAARTARCGSESREERLDALARAFDDRSLHGNGPGQHGAVERSACDQVRELLGGHARIGDAKESSPFQLRKAVSERRDDTSGGAVEVVHRQRWKVARLPDEQAAKGDNLRSHDGKGQAPPQLVQHLVHIGRGDASGKRLVQRACEGVGVFDRLGDDLRRIRQQFHTPCDPLRCDVRDDRSGDDHYEQQNARHDAEEARH